METLDTDKIVDLLMLQQFLETEGELEWFNDLDDQIQRAVLDTWINYQTEK